MAMSAAATPIASPAAKIARNIRIVILLEPVSGRAPFGARHRFFDSRSRGRKDEHLMRRRSFADVAGASVRRARACARRAIRR
jgi:hypothetical protein